MMPAGVIQVRTDICGDCKTPCDLQHKASAHAECAAACPIRKWAKWGNCADPITPPSPSPSSLPAPGGVTAPAGMRGLGDLVAVIADPIARAINLDKSKCRCGQRIDWLNAAVPFAKQKSGVT